MTRAAKAVGRFINLLSPSQKSAEFNERIFFFLAVLPALLVAYVICKTSYMSGLVGLLALAPTNTFFLSLIIAPYLYLILFIFIASSLGYLVPALRARRINTALAFAVFSYIFYIAIITLIERDNSKALLRLEQGRWLGEAGIVHSSYVLITLALTGLIIWRTGIAFIFKQRVWSFKKQPTTLYQSRTALFVIVNFLALPLWLPFIPTSLSPFSSSMSVQERLLPFVIPSLAALSVLALTFRHYKLAEIFLQIYRAAILLLGLYGFFLVSILMLQVTENNIVGAFMLTLILIALNCLLPLFMYYCTWVAHCTLRALPHLQPPEKEAVPHAPYPAYVET